MPSELNAPSQTNTQKLSNSSLYHAPFETIARQSLACPLNFMRRPKRLHHAYHVLCSMHRPKELLDGAQNTF